MHPIVSVMEVAGLLSRQDIRAAIHTLQDGLKANGGVGREAYPMRHTIVGNTYAREMTMFEGTTVIGELHKHEHLNFIMRGRVKVLTELEGFQEYVAPCMFVSPAGTKRLVHVLEDCVWVAVHEISSTDPDEIEREVIAKDYDELYIVGECTEVP